MRPTTKIVCGFKNVGMPKDSEEFEGTVQECVKFIVNKLLKSTMNKRMDICLARDLDEVRAGLGRTQDKQSIEDMVDSMFSEEDFMNDIDAAIAEGELENQNGRD